MSKLSSLIPESFIYSDLGTAGLKMTAKRYTTPRCDTEGLTLLFIHCIGAHKEQWEPTIAKIIDLQQSKRKRQRVREAWAFDWQNHGEAGVINNELLDNFPNGISVRNWGMAIADFVKSSAMDGHRMVAIAHSAGTGAIMLALNEFSRQQLPFLSLFLVEPTIVPQDYFNENLERRIASAEGSMKAAFKRRDSWTSKDNAASWLSNRAPWKSWDPRVLRLYVDHGLRIIRNENETDSVVLNCPKRQEGTVYIHFADYLEGAALMKEMCTLLPINIVFGDVDDFVESQWKARLCKGIPLASVTRVPNSGHLVVQENPDGLAAVICDKLNESLHGYYISRI